MNIFFKNTLRSILFISFLIFLMASCSNERVEGSFTEDELKWLVYEKGDTIDFYNEEMGIIHFVVTEKTELNQVSDKFPIEAEILLESDENDAKLKIYLLKDQFSFKRYVRLNHIYRPLDLLSPLENIEIDGLRYFNVYEIEEGSSDKSLIHTAKFNKNNGFLEFTDSTGMRFYRTNLSESELQTTQFVSLER